MTHKKCPIVNLKKLTNQKKLSEIKILLLEAQKQKLFNKSETQIWVFENNLEYILRYF